MQILEKSCFIYSTIFAANESQKIKVLKLLVSLQKTQECIVMVTTQENPVETLPPDMLIGMNDYKYLVRSMKRQ